MKAKRICPKPFPVSIIVQSLFLSSFISVAPAFSDPEGSSVNSNDVGAGARSLKSKNEIAKPTAKAEADVDFGPYMADLQRRIKRQWFPPRAEESKRVRVVFKVASDGAISELKISESSNSEGADRAGLLAVSKAAPFRPLPVGAPESVDIQFTFDYNVFGSGDNEIKRLKKEIAECQSRGELKDKAKKLAELAQLYQNKMLTEEAVKCRKDALALLSEKVDDKTLETVLSSSLGKYYYDEKNYREAQKYYRRAFLLRKDNDETAFDINQARRDLALALIHDPEYQGTEPLNLLNDAISDTANDGDRSSSNAAKKALAEYFSKSKQYARALPLYAFLLAESIKTQGPISAAVLNGNKDQADCLYEMGRYKGALQGYKQVVAIANYIGAAADQAALNQAKLRLDELKNNPELKNAVHKEEARERVDKSYAWLPFALGGSLLALLFIHLSRQKQNGDINIAGKGSGNNNT